MEARIHSRLAEYAAAEKLPADYPALAQRWFAPLADWLVEKWQGRGGAVLLVGINGAQGTGKSTLCWVLELLLAERGARGLTLSIDDFYLPRARREQLARQVHPLLRTRGVPGTHELPLLDTVLDELLAGRACPAPRFDKSADDRRPDDEWAQLEPVDIILLEGWCVGCPPQPEAALQTPANTLEALEDATGEWRAWVNAQLRGGYAALFARLDRLVVLQAPSLAAVLQWRGLQEQKLAQSRQGSAVMDAAAIKRFVQHYERLTRHCLQALPGRADYLLRLAPDHRIESALVR